MRDVFGSAIRQDAGTAPEPSHAAAAALPTGVCPAGLTWTAVPPAPDDPLLAGKTTCRESNGHITRTVAIG